MAVAWSAACSRAPSLPGAMTFEGARLEKATSWSNQGTSGVVFVPPGKSLPTASLRGPPRLPCVRGVAACAEADRQLDDEDVGRCATGPSACWEDVCTARWEPTRASLEAILDGVLKR